MKPQMNTDERGAAQPQPKRISPQRRRERGGSVPGSARFQRALGVEHPCTQDACAPRSFASSCLRGGLSAAFLPQRQEDRQALGCGWVAPCSSVFICGFKFVQFLLPAEVDGFQVLRNMTFPAEIRSDLRGEGFARSRLSMHDESTFRGGAEIAQPAKNFARIRMRRKGFHTLDLRPSLHRFSVNLYLPGAVLQQLPARSVGLEADKQNRVSRVRQPVHQMV